MTTDTNFTHIAWFDLETDNLDTKGCHVLEVACVLTDLQFTDIAWVDSLIWNGSEESFDICVAKMSSVVHEMHEANGLIESLRNSLQGLGQPVYATGDIDDLLVNHMDHFKIKPGNVMLAGSGVARFDRPIAERLFPKFASYLHYAELDMATIRRYLKVIGMPWLLPSNETKAHRAMADVLQSLDQARFTAEICTRAFLDPSTNI